MGKLTDDLMKLIYVSNAINGTTTVSIEIDLELPRGYVANIYSIFMSIENIANVLDTGEETQVVSALVRDPDDSTTTAIPANSTQHDVIADIQTEFVQSAVATDQAGQAIQKEKWVFFGKDIDVITARNMRWNTVATDTDISNASHRVEIYYKLEKINDSEILELLDIL